VAIVHTEDRLVLERVLEWAAAGHDFFLVSVLRTWGSAPRAPGAWMGLRADGHVVGSVSGGCIEADLIEQVRAGTLSTEKLSRKQYGVTREEAARFRLPCGGQLELLIETCPALDALRQLADGLATHQCWLRQVDLRSGEVTLHPAKPGEKTCYDGERLRTLYGPGFRLLLIGAGSLSQQVAQFALALDYQVQVCEPRVEYLHEWPLSEVNLTQAMPDDAVLQMVPDAQSAILALTHDPKLDDMALIEALNSQAFYVGALGSRANGQKKRERLLQFDLSPDQVARLHCPVGLDLGAHTPAEIALAVLAELTALRNACTIERHHAGH
jgi:xanthine dehydrogenase accessory factor